MASPGAAAGAAAESAATRYLELRGLQIVQRNFRCRLGEIDIVAWDKQELVFVEVRLRNNLQFGSGAESVTAAKQRKLARAARYYLLTQSRANPDPICRFDVLSLRQRHYPYRARWQVQWITDAFSF
ncbi:MAG: YraN family protein [Pseudomonadales bacterium]